MRFSSRIPLQAALLAALTGCAAGSKPVVFQAEKFDSSDTYSHHFPVSSGVACEAVRRALLSQGYLIDAATAKQVDGRKNFQPQSDVHVQIMFRVVCAADGADNKAAVFANALQDNYALKKVNNSASLGVGAVGSFSLPFFSSTDDSLVKVASETIAEAKFYARFFQLVGRHLPNEPAPAEQHAETPH